MRDILNLSNCNWIWIHNHLICKGTLNSLAKLASLTEWLIVHLRTKWLWIRILLQLLIDDSLVKYLIPDQMICVEQM